MNDKSGVDVRITAVIKNTSNNKKKIIVNMTEAFGSVLKLKKK